MDDIEKEISSAVTAGIRHIGIGIYSSGKIRQYLISKGFSPSVSSCAVEELVERKYIDNRRAGRKVLLFRVGKKQESRALLYDRLLSSGIPSDIADEIISGVDDDLTTCLRLYEAISDIYDRDDQVSFLKNAHKRGYSAEVSHKAYNIFTGKYFR